MNKRLLFVDTETGGVDAEKHSLLSIGLVVWDSHEGVLFEKEIKIKHKEYCVTKSAQNINHFSRIEHEKDAISSKKAIAIFYDIKERFFEDYNSIPLAGHNISFDIQFIRHLFLNNNRSFEKLFSHRSVDTYSIIKFLVDCGLLPESINSSASAFKHFYITVQGRHTSLGDARATAELYKEMIGLLR